MRRLCLAVGVVVLLVGCRGIASSAGAPTAVPKLASSARVTESGIPKVVIDRACSKLGDGPDEYVCVTNQDVTVTDMSSWVLRNVMGRSFNFPQGFKLEPGQTVKVHTGAGTNAPADLHWGYSVNPAWEKGDKLTLSNNENVEVFVSEAQR